MPKPKPKKMGNPNNQSVDGFRGVSAESLRAKRLAAKTPAGQQDADRIVSYDPKAVRAAIEAQACPFCGAGPYKSVGIHTARIHGVTAAELRKLAGWTKGARICSPEHSQKMNAVLTGRPDWKDMREKAAARAVAAGTISVASEVWVEIRKSASVERDTKIMQLFTGGETLGDIGSALGVSRSTVKAVLARNGMVADARSRRPPAYLERVRWGSQAQRQEIVNLYATGELPQWQIAERYDISQTTVSKILREHGECAKGDGTITRTLKPCGSMAAFRRHKRHGEIPCDACDAAYRDANVAVARKRVGGGDA